MLAENVDIRDVICIPLKMICPLEAPGRHSRFYGFVPSNRVERLVSQLLGAETKLI